MKLFIVIVLAMLLSVVALAGISPPTKKQQKQTVTASIVRPQILVAPRTIETPATSLVAVQVKYTERALHIAGANPFHAEVNAVARSGSQPSHAGTINVYSPRAEVERDIGRKTFC